MLEKIRRPYRFVTFAVWMSVTIIFVWNILFETGLLANTLAGTVIGGAAGVSSLLFILSAVFRKHWLLHYALLLAAATWVGRMVFVGLTDGLDGFTTWLSLAWTIVIVGAFILEMYDPEHSVSSGVIEVKQS